MKLRWDWGKDPLEVPSAPQPVPVPEEDELLGVGPVELGERAETLLRDPLLKAAFARVRRDVQEIWLHSKAGERDQREECHQMIVAIDNVERALKGYINAKKIVEQRRAA